MSQLFANKIPVNVTTTESLAYPESGKAKKAKRIKNTEYLENIKFISGTPELHS
nr:hypothetical protein [Escherichia coli]